MEDFPTIDLVEYSEQRPTFSDPEKTILHSPRWGDGKILELAATGPYRAFVNSQNLNFSDELLASMKIMANPEGFLKNPISALYQAKPTFLSIKFNKPEEKELILEKIEPYIQAAESSNISDHMRIVFEELFMNAIYDAPHEASKQGRPRSKKKCEVIIAHDNNKATLTMRDPYGSLYIPKLIQRMHDIEKYGTQNIINLGRPGGAGIGCSLLYRYSMSITIVVKPNEQTLVTCAFPLRTSYKQFCSIGKNLLFLNIAPNGGHNGK